MGLNFEPVRTSALDRRNIGPILTTAGTRMEQAAIHNRVMRQIPSLNH
jgi:hypothetical protein